MTAANIAPFIRGAHHLVYRADGLVRPSRMSNKQMDAAREAGRERAASYTAGVTINLVTTGDEVSFDLSVVRPIHFESSSVSETIDLARRRGDDRAAENGLVDGIDLYVDGVYATTAPVEDGPVTLAFDNPSHAPACLTVYLPCLMSVAVGNLSTNGSLERAPERGYLLALGDSITQGYVVGTPGSSWPARVSRALGLDLVNQAIAGHRFDAHTLRGMKLLRENPPAAIVVAYGTNDWAHTDSANDLVEHMSRYLSKLADRFCDTPVYVLGPIWRGDIDEPRPHGRSLAWVGSVLCDECARLGLNYVDGTDLVPADAGLYADGRLHPDANGAAHMAAGVIERLEQDGLVELLGGRHDEPRARADAQTRLRPAAPRRQRELEQAVRTIWRLRQPDGCPWDRVQTHESIKKNMIEEAYEAVDAIESGDATHLREELGDVLMQVLLHAQIAADAGEFTFADICRDLDEKLVRRHPHVFGSGVSAADADEVLDIWSRVKLEERRDVADAEQAPKSLLDAVPRALPSLMQAQKISKKAAACGFDWESTEDVWDKVDEERREFSAEESGSERALEEFGDVLFSAVNVARKEGIDAETALRRSCEKFRERWAAMEAEAAGSGVSLEDLSHEELEELWVRAKRGEASEG